MKSIVLGLAVSLACAGAQARSAHPAHDRDALIRLIADASAWSEMCVNYAVDPAALALFRDVHRIRVDGHYIKVYGFAYARQHALAYESHRVRAACDRALALYGPNGSLAPGLVRPLFHGTVPDQWINLDRF
jgi:hypothetical protein